jgi:hypothetical protein
MHKEFISWLLGALFFVIGTFALYWIGIWISPYNHLSLLESWGVIMLGVLIKGGMEVYKTGVPKS